MEEKKGITDSLKELNSAHSSKKVGAWFAILTAAILSYKYADDKTLIAIILIWLAFASLCFGLTNIKELQELKNGKKDEQTSNN